MASRESTVVSKLPWDLVPMDALEEVIKVLEKGATKYSPNNWRAAPHFRPSQLVASALRHLVARYWHGEMYDQESGLLHTAHAGCNILFMIYYDKFNLYSNEPDTIVVNGDVESVKAEGKIERFEKLVGLEDVLGEMRVTVEKSPLELAKEALEKRRAELGLDKVTVMTVKEPGVVGGVEYQTRSISEMARLEEEEEE